MKKILTILLAFCLLLSLAACGGAPVENPTPSQEVTSVGYSQRPAVA